MDENTMRKVGVGMLLVAALFVLVWQLNLFSVARGAAAFTYYATYEPSTTPNTITATIYENETQVFYQKAQQGGAVPQVRGQGIGGIQVLVDGTPVLVNFPNPMVNTTAKVEALNGFDMRLQEGTTRCLWKTEQSPIVPICASYDCPTGYVWYQSDGVCKKTGAPNVAATVTYNNATCGAFAPCKADGWCSAPVKKTGMPVIRVTVSNLMEGQHTITIRGNFVTQGTTQSQWTSDVERTLCISSVSGSQGGTLTFTDTVTVSPIGAVIVPTMPTPTPTPSNIISAPPQAAPLSWTSQISSVLTGLFCWAGILTC